MRGRARKDNNHRAIVEALTNAGSFVLDLSSVGRGVPDIVLWTAKGWQVAEIKNPAYSYGKKGATPMQKKWAAAAQAPVYLLRSVDEAMLLLLGETEKLERIVQ